MAKKSVQKKELSRGGIAYAAADTAIALGAAAVTRNPLTVAGAVASAANLVREIFW